MNSQALARSALFGALAIAMLGHQVAFAQEKPAAKVTINNCISNIKNNLAAPTPTGGAGGKAGADATPTTQAAFNTSKSGIKSSVGAGGTTSCDAPARPATLPASGLNSPAPGAAGVAVDPAVQTKAESKGISGK